MDPKESNGKIEQDLVMIDNWTEILQASPLSPSLLVKLEKVCHRIETDLDKERAQIHCRLDEIQVRLTQLIEQTTELCDLQKSQVQNVINTILEKKPTSERATTRDSNSVPNETKETFHLTEEEKAKVRKEILMILYEQDQTIDHLKQENAQKDKDIHNLEMLNEKLFQELREEKENRKKDLHLLSFNKGIPWVSNLRELNANLRKKKACPFVPLKS